MARKKPVSTRPTDAKDPPTFRDMSEYEKMRLVNIQRNNALLESLDIHTAVLPIADSKVRGQRKPRQGQVSDSVKTGGVKRKFQKMPAVTGEYGVKLRRSGRRHALEHEKELSVQGHTFLMALPDSWDDGDECKALRSNQSETRRERLDDQTVKVALLENQDTAKGWGCEQGVESSSNTTFDARRMHQHLSRSSTGRAVATTGPAGYGVALCTHKGRKCTGKNNTWQASVRAVSFGSGGFGVGVVRDSFRPPFKSLGKTLDAVGAYLCTGVFASHGRERAWGRPFEEGDRITVTLRQSGGREGQSVGGGAGGGGGAAAAAGEVTREEEEEDAARAREVVFEVNGEEVGVVLVPRSWGGVTLVLAVQPYMGGVALLI